MRAFCPSARRRNALLLPGFFAVQTLRFRRTTLEALAAVFAITVGWRSHLASAQVRQRATAGQRTANEFALEAAVERFEQLAPKSPAELAALDDEASHAAALAVEAAAAGIDFEVGSDNIQKEVERLLAAKARIDAGLEQLLAWRGEVARVDLPDERQRLALRAYLRTAARWIDLSGRLRYALSDTLRDAVELLADAPAARMRLLARLKQANSSIGATVMAGDLFAGDDDRSDGWQPLPAAGRGQVLDLIASCKQAALLPELARLVSDRGAPAALRIRAAETIRAVGLPQTPRPDGPADLPAPPITPKALEGELRGMALSRLDAALARRRNELLKWLAVRVRQGVVEDSYRIGPFEVRAGDWLLMRNPSPFNLFTDLSPGLFTHVGVVAVEQGADGVRRFVIVDLPEHGSRIPAANVETYLQRTLHYVFLRRPDAATARQLGDAAREIIGNECQFDLNFRTERVLALAGQPLGDRKIHTYCAGLLLLCALQTDAPREEFFPVAERSAGGRTAENLARLGISVGADFISPTGALFSPKLEIVGRREPMYDPGREIEEAIFDRFARQLAAKPLTESPDLPQWLRQKAAEAAAGSPELSKLLAKAADVDEQTDLVAAARAAAVVEALDEVAFGASAKFAQARRWLRAAPAAELARAARQGAEFSAAELAAAADAQKRHAQLYRQWQDDRLTPRALRQKLVDYYIAAGNRELDERFFSEPPAPKRRSKP